MLTSQALLGLPAYLYGVGLMFWVFQLAAITGFIKWWRVDAGRNDVCGAVRFLKWAFRYRVLKLGTNNVYQGRCMYLANHRSWADFFIDMFVIGCRGAPLSRVAVGLAFPAFTSSLLAVRSILLFNRSNIKDPEVFNRWIDSKLAASPQPGLLVYPEGTRSQASASLALKRGMLRSAYTRKMPVQAVVTAHKEEVLNERRMWAHFGRTLVTGCSEVLESSRFEDFDSFMTAVQALWDKQWAAVHAAPRYGLPELPTPQGVPGNYSPATLAKQSASLAFWLLVMVALARWTLRGLLAAAAWLPLGWVLLAGLVAWVAASLAAATLRPPPESRGLPPADSSADVAGDGVGLGLSERKVD